MYLPQSSKNILTGVDSGVENNSYIEKEDKFMDDIDINSWVKLVFVYIGKNEIVIFL